MGFREVKVKRVLAAAETVQLDPERVLDKLILQNAKRHQSSAGGVILNLSDGIADRIEELLRVSETDEDAELQELLHPKKPAETNPASTETHPVVTETNPVVTETNPVVNETNPVVNETNPVVNETETTDSESPESASKSPESSSESPEFVSEETSDDVEDE